MNIGQFLRGIGRPCTYHPGLSRVVGGVKACLFLENLNYWFDKTTDPDKWVYKSREELLEETGLSYDEQAGARNTLKRLGLLEEKHKRIEHRVYFKVNYDKLEELWEGGCQLGQNGNSPLGETENPTSPSGKIPFPEGGKSNSVNKVSSLTTSRTTSPIGNTPAASPDQPRRTNWAGDQFPALKVLCPEVETKAGIMLLNAMSKQYGGHSVVEECLARLKGPIAGKQIWGAFHQECGRIVTQRATGLGQAKRTSFVPVSEQFASEPVDQYFHKPKGDHDTDTTTKRPA